MQPDLSNASRKMCKPAMQRKHMWTPGPVSLRLLPARQDGRPSDDARDCRVILRSLAPRGHCARMGSMGRMQSGGF